MIGSPAKKARQKRYRERQKEKGISVSGSEYKMTNWNNGYFIALDGEGESYGDSERFETAAAGGKPGKVYHARPHKYTLLAASTGDSLYNKGSALETMACLDFLLDLGTKHKRGIFIIFAGGYDINHMFLFGFDKASLQAIIRGKVRVAENDTDFVANGAFRFEHKNTRYEIEYRPRKSLTLRRGLTFKQDSKGVWKKKWADKIIIWDVFGFFQESFVQVMHKWLGPNYKHYELIKRMKLLRGNFEHVKQSDINEYNAAELDALVRIMDKVRNAIDGLGFMVTRWDGAGAIAAAMLRKHKIKEHKKEFAPDIIEASRTAYAGGRIEICKNGTLNREVYDYDINSAYPHIMASLPCLACGHWVSGIGFPPDGFTLVRIRFSFARSLPFYPLFYRTKEMQISFPREGEGWYWYPEYAAALETPGTLDVLEWRHFAPDCQHKPFHWIPDYYRTRQLWVKNPTEDWQSGGEKILKLGLNSLYGKTAQQVGGRARQPAYHQLEWAGYITSATRARLYMASAYAAESVIGFATDGIFTTVPLDGLELDRFKQIGGWDYKAFTGLTLAMAGVYWWHDGDKFKHFSRGFDKESMETPARISQAWRDGKTSVDIKMHRLIGIGSACANETFWQMRGRFVDSMRTLRIDGHSHKRKAPDIKKHRRDRKMVDLGVHENIAYDESKACSFPYPLTWIDADYQRELEEERESCDTENI